MEIQKCLVHNDFSFQVDDERQIQAMLTSCFLNPKICYKSVIEPVLDIELLKAISRKEW